MSNLVLNITHTKFSTHYNIALKNKLSTLTYKFDTALKILLKASLIDRLSLAIRKFSIWAKEEKK